MAYSTLIEVGRPHVSFTVPGVRLTVNCMFPLPYEVTLDADGHALGAEVFVYELARGSVSASSVVPSEVVDELLLDAATVDHGGRISDGLNVASRLRMACLHLECPEMLIACKPFQALAVGQCSSGSVHVSGIATVLP